MRSVALRYRRGGIPRDRMFGNWSDAPVHRYFGRTVDEACTLGGDGPQARESELARLEAVLFLSREPLGSRKLAQLADLADGTRARTLVRKLGRLYDAEGCAFCVVEVAGGFQLMSRPKFSPWLRRLQSSPVQVCLSVPAMDTLSVVAYRQPVLRATIESIRGVQCGEILRQLMERELVRIVGRSEELGRPFLYGTTKRFLAVFGLRHLDDLPKTGLLRPPEPAPADPEPCGSQEDDTDEETAMQSNQFANTEEGSTVKTEVNIIPASDDISGLSGPESLEDDGNEEPDVDADESEDEDWEEEEKEGDDWDDADEDWDEDDDEDEDEDEDDEDNEDEWGDGDWEEVPDDDEEEGDDEDDDDEDDDDEDDDDEDDDDEDDDDEDDDDEDDDDEDDDDEDEYEDVDTIDDEDDEEE
jgi:segregation and condensation protein B